jgi:hypothetical protein
MKMLIHFRHLLADKIEVELLGEKEMKRQMLLEKKLLESQRTHLLNQAVSILDKRPYKACLN